MADHLDFIRIRGLETPSEAEVFQGIGGGTVTSAPGSGETPSLEWGEIPQEAIEMVSTYTQDLNTWLAEALRYDPDSGSRALPPGLLDNIPVIPLITSLVATGGASLPAVATVVVSQVLMNYVGSAVANYAESLDENSPVNLLKKAFLYDNNGTQESILKTAFLRLTDPEYSILQQKLAEIRDGVNDLAMVDATVHIGDDLKARIKGKALEF